MRPIILLVITVGVGSAILGSIAIQLFMPADDSSQQFGLEEKCEKIAEEGFKIQVKYPEIDFDRMTKEDADTLRYLDHLWINDCVTKLPGEKIFDIAKRVEQNYYSGE